jgi:hypothetical protein
VVALPHSRLINLKLEPLGHEGPNTHHQSLTDTFPAQMDVAFIRVAYLAASPAPQLAVNFVEHDVALKKRKGTLLGYPLHAWAEQLVFHHPCIQALRER